jgi:glycosyltransferase involved in cell wall biosynthesis
VVAISESTKRDVCSVLRIRPERVFVAPLAAEPGIFYECNDQEKRVAVRRRCKIPDGPYLLSLCTLEPRKNLASLVRAFCRMARQHPELKLSLVLVGAAGWHSESLDRALAGAAGLRDRIILPGYVPDADLASLYSGAHAFAYLSEYEGFGLPPLEAMQCGVPVIASGTTSLPEVVGDAGVLVNPQDETAVAEALCRLCRDEAWRQDLGARGKVRASMFTWQRCVDNVMATYQAAMLA